MNPRKALSERHKKFITDEQPFSQARASQPETTPTASKKHNLWPIDLLRNKVQKFLKATHSKLFDESVCYKAIS